MVALVAGVGVLVLVATSSFAAGDHRAGSFTPLLKPAHMTGGWVSQPCPCPMGRMGGAMIGPGMMGRMMDPGMMDPGMMGPGMMDPGWMHGPTAHADLDLSADDVRARLERNLAWHGNKRLKVGEVKEADDDTIIAEIVTIDGSLVQRFAVDRHTGWTKRAD
jgi:hypothetical protein